MLTRIDDRMNMISGRNNPHWTFGTYYSSKHSLYSKCINFFSDNKFLFWKYSFDYYRIIENSLRSGQSNAIMEIYICVIGNMSRNKNTNTN